MTRRAGAICVALLGPTGCVVPGRVPPPTGSSNAYDAVGYAAAAGALTAAEEAEKAEAQNAPMRPTACGPSFRETCNTGRALPDRADDDERDEMTPLEARRHALTYINGLRSLRRLPLLELDDGLTEFAQDGSDQVAKDHRPHGHFRDKAAACPRCGENQSGAQGWRTEAVGRQIDEILGLMMAEGPGGGHHDNLLDPRWRYLGVGITNPGGEMYLTLDFAP